MAGQGQSEAQILPIEVDQALLQGCAFLLSHCAILENFRSDFQMRE